MTIIYAILLFCLLIFVHEFGHFITAKAVGVKVNEFALGMGPVIFQRQKGETMYSLRAFPIGGFCAMEGEDDESEDDRAFNKRPAWAKVLVLVAGSAMNVILAILVLSLIAFSTGIPNTYVRESIEGGPAFSAGIVEGDKIVEINNEKIKEWTDIGTSLAESKGEQVSVTVKRDGELIIFDMPIDTSEDGRKVIGIYPQVSKNPFKVLVYGCESAWNMTVNMVKVIGMLFSGDVPVSELTGPVGIVHAVGDTVQYGFKYLGYLTALISLNLAIVNMLPFPALDGGRLLFVIIRKVTGRVITDEIEAKIHFAGILILFGLMIYVTWQDIIRFILPIFGS